MVVSFNDIPSNVLTPGHYVEVDDAAAVEGSGIRPQQAVLVGHKLSGGAASDGSGVTLSDGTANLSEVYRLTSLADATGFFGAGSMLEAMADAFLAVNTQVPLYAVAVPEAGTEATGTLQLAGSASLAGTLHLYVAGERIQVTIASGDTATTVATAAAAAVNAISSLPMTATATAGTITFTAKHPGTAGNFLDVRFNYADGEAFPAGITSPSSENRLSGGTGDASIASSIFVGEQYDTIATGLNGDSSMDDLEAMLADRWDPLVNLDGHCFAAYTGTVGETTTYLDVSNRNSFHTTVACPGKSPTPPWVIAAQVAAVDSAQIDIDPARPRTGQSLPSVAAPGLSDRLDQSNRQAILLAGGASIKLTPSGGSIVDRLTTTYKQNDQGASDPTWFDLSTKRTVSYLRWDWDNRMERKYQDFKLASDGTNFAPGQAVVTPSTIRGEAISWFSEKEQDGLVENLDQFREALIVERNTTDLNRLDAILRPDVINKFVVSATKLQFKL